MEPTAWAIERELRILAHQERVQRALARIRARRLARGLPAEVYHAPRRRRGRLGQCPGCGRAVRLEGRGKLRRHRIGGHDGLCAGSGMRPAREGVG